MQTETNNAKPSQKELRLARRWAPKNAEKIEHPDGQSVAFIAPYTHNKGDGKDLFQATGYWGSAGKPSFNFVYKTRADAEKKVAEFFAGITSRKEVITKRKESRKVEAVQPIKHGDYVSVVQTAKLIRVQLAKKFPTVKFSVVSDSYSGGASIRIVWKDGPTNEHVKQIVNAFGGSDFDGMIDLKYSVKAWLLPDGSAAFGRSAGTGGNGGSDPAYQFPKPHPDAIEVHFGADFIFTNRHYSKEFLETTLGKVCAEYGCAVPEIKTGFDGDAYYVQGIDQSKDHWIRKGVEETVGS